MAEIFLQAKAKCTKLHSLILYLKPIKLTNTKNLLMNFSEETIEQLAKEHYGLATTAKSLNGYDELNFLLSTDTNEKYILKISSEVHPLPFLDAQVKIIQHLSKSALANEFQHFCINIHGDALTKIEADSKTY